MKVTFYGASGSIPTPSNRTFSRTEFGGNTTCIFLEVGDRFIVIDMGSGARALGNMLAKRMPFDAHVFFTHLHWDHIQGMPFFTPLYVPGNKLHFHAPEKTKTDPIASVEEVLSNQMQYPTFPRQLRQCPAFVDFTIFKWFDPAFVLYEKAGDKTSKPIVRVTHFELNHPDECVGYVVEECATGKKFACVTDTEQYSVLNTNIQKACKGVDLYYADAQYTEDEYSGKSGMSRTGWGHSTPEACIKEAEGCGVGHILIGHHDPGHDDKFLTEMEAEARGRTRINLSFVREGDTFEI